MSPSRFPATGSGAHDSGFLAAHATATADLFARLSSGPEGLSAAEAARRLQIHGPNQLERAKATSAWALLANQLRSVVVFLLVAAALTALLFGDVVEAAAIGAVLLINTAIGFLTEYRARRAIDALIDLDVPQALVLRDGALSALDARQIVPGDVVEINTGRQVPADGRVFQSADLRMDEAALTGESLPVSKSVDAVPEATELADRASMVYKGTTIAAGTGRMLVTATGSRTEIGRIGTLLSGVADEPTPLERRLDALGRRLVWLALGVAALVAALGFLQGQPVGLVIEMGIALAVAAVPEALPAVATIALAVGVRRMAHRQALVRRLPAVESLGSTTVVCTDKTRTLTSGDMTAVRVRAGDDDVDLTAATADTLPSSARTLLEAAVLASRPQAAAAAGGGAEQADPVDAALLACANRFGIDRTTVISGRQPLGLVPFSSERKLLASFHREDGRSMAYVKGAPQRLLALSARGADGQPLDDDSRRRLESANDALAGAGLRVLSVACGPVADASEAALRDLRFLGFVGFIDPPAPGVGQTIQRLRDAGLRTVMVTGDQRLTAQAIGRELGVVAPDAEMLTGRDLDDLAAPDLATRVGRVAAFSRISPEHKLLIVEALQANGEIVAMLGDGVNDAPALKKADVGVAMGRRGTDVAKQAAAIVLQDDRFETIAAAVEEGRVIFDNIRKFVFYLFSCNVAEVLVLLAAGLAGLPSPLTPLQLLWLNMVTDTFPALALALEPADPDVMHRPPRDPQEAILSPAFLRSILVWGALLTVATLGTYLWALRVRPDQAATMAFMALTFAQIFHLGNARSPSAVVGRRAIVANRWALGAVALTVGLQLLAMYARPLAAVLDVQLLDAGAWAIVVAGGGAPAVVGQVWKLVGGRR